jgi:hypothetical protein
MILFEKPAYKIFSRKFKDIKGVGSHSGDEEVDLSEDRLGGREKL